MTRKHVDVAVIIPDASPILTLAQLDRLDLFNSFSVPVRIVDQVNYEITKPENDPKGVVNAWMKRQHNQIEVIETNVGYGFKTRLERGEKPKSSSLGEVAVDEYATMLALRSDPNFIPLVLFEDPDVLETRIARLKRVHLLNTTAWLMTLHREGLLPEALDLVERINASRKTPMEPFERVGLTKKVRSTWIRRSFKNADET